MWLLLLIASCMAVVYWKPLFWLTVSYLAYKLVRLGIWAYKRQKAAQHEAERQLIEDADTQHRCVQMGLLAGVYGNYPPPRECRGMGIWMAGK